MIVSILAYCMSFVTADPFIAMADRLYETMRPHEVEAGNVIFMKMCDAEDFFHAIHPQLQVPYVLITHLTDESTPGALARYLDEPLLLAWFAINWDGTRHPKLHPIPIGLANQKLPHGHLTDVTAVQQMQLPKKHLLFMNFTIQTFSEERWEVFKQFAKAPYCYRTGKKPFREYLIDMASSKFVLAPRGAGLDTYRLWEALYVGSIPIVKTSSLDLLYEGLPVLIVQDWSEVTESFLEEKYREFVAREFCWEKLDMAYWQLQIKKCFP
ncbi:MAG: hypothetical protein HY069_01540 [Chlamydiia bacterium]|nr:hypothetical protein [Chlamydiia bacterium]